MSDLRALIERLAELEKKATPGPWHALPKFQKSLADHGYRSVARGYSDRTDHLYAEAERIWREGEGWKVCVQYDMRFIAALRNAFPQIVAALRDAERYRWLKAHHLQTGDDSWIRTGDDLEEAIDAALADDEKRSEQEDK